IKDTYSEPYLGGQNSYAEFAEIAKRVNESFLQGSDEYIEAMFDEAASSYWNGESSRAKALNDFLNYANHRFGW
ncbi:MAG: carbohydrate ABC transporter substrate-binding protein, partial [Treponema sp.]|nr:carbohydrate ABC transporter substrate-binding protein [Treponema sp.]